MPAACEMIKLLLLVHRHASCSNFASSDIEEDMPIFVSIGFLKPIKLKRIENTLIL